MKRLRQYLRGRDLSPRQVVLLTIGLMAIGAAWAMNSFILPACRELATARDFSRSEAVQYAQLATNLSVGKDVNAAFDQLDRHLIQMESDSVTLSDFLKTLEQARAHYPDMRIVNVKPLAVQDFGPYRVYHVKLAVAARLQEVLEFVSELTGGADALGLESFSLRSVQGRNVVECSLSLNLVRLLPHGKATVKRRGPIGHKEDPDAL